LALVRFFQTGKSIIVIDVKMDNLACVMHDSDAA
jgi:hypothetical protein